jgi:tetratricopeptide (TPR) repeat protein
MINPLSTANPEQVVSNERSGDVSQRGIPAAAVGVAAAPTVSDDRGYSQPPSYESDSDESSSGSSSSGSSSSSSSSSSDSQTGSYDSRSVSSSSSSSSSGSSTSSSGSSTYSSSDSDSSSFSPEPAMASEESFGSGFQGAFTKTPAPTRDDASTPPPPPRHVTKGMESTMVEEGSSTLLASSLQSDSPRQEQQLGRALNGVPLRRAQSPTTTVSSLSASQIGSRRAVQEERPPPSIQTEDTRKKRRRKRDKRGRRPEGLANFETNVNETLSSLSKDESRLGVRTLVAMDGPKESVATETLSMAPHTAHHLLHGFEALLAALLQVSDELELLSTFNGANSGMSREALNAILSHAPALDSVFVTLRPMLQHYLEEEADPEMDALLSRVNKLIRLLCEITYRVCQRQEWSARSETVFVTLIELLERLTVEITCLYDGLDLPDYKMTVKLRRAWSATGHMEEIKAVYVTSDSWMFQQVCYEVIVSTDQWCPDTKDLAEACEVKQPAGDVEAAGQPSPDARMARVPQLALQVLDKINGDPLIRPNTLASILRRILPPHALTDTAVLNTFSGLRATVRKPLGFSGANMVAISSVPEVLNDPDAYGMRGIGKTTMAAMVAAHPDTRRFFKDGIAWVNIGPKELNYARYTQCLRELVSQLEFYDGVPLFAELLHTPGEPLSRRKRREVGFMIYARDTVSELLQNRNVLIVLDDVYFESDLEWFTFTPAVPVSMVGASSRNLPDGKTTLLVTTRTRDLLHAADTVEMDLLDEQDAIRLLVNESGLSSDYAIAESKEALAVVRECANHPLAVKTVGRWLGLKHASAGVINSVEEIHEDVAQSIDRILKSGDIQGADMMYEIMSMSFSPAVNGEPTNVIKLCFAAFVTVFCNEEYYSDFLPGVYPPMIPVSTADVLFETLLELEEDSLFQEGSLFYTQRREATMLIPEALSKLGVLKVITTYSGDSEEEQSLESSRYSLNDSRFLQIMHFIQYEYGEYLANEEDGMRALTQDAERRWNEAFATAYIKQAADWDSELPDASRDYAVEMIVSHMLRAEMYEEAARLLANETFVRGRIYTLGRENATRRHIMDCETLFSLLSEQDEESKSGLNPRSSMKRAYEALGAQLNPKDAEYDMEERRVLSIEAGRAHYEIGFSLAERRCWHAAIAHWESSQELLLSSLGMVEFVAAIQYNVGVVFAEMNEYEQGLASLKQCLRIRGAIHGEEHILYAQTIQKIGDVFLGMSDYAEAMDSYNWALDVMHIEPSHHRVDIGDILDNMGNIHYSMGEVSEALRCYEDALRSKKVELGDDHHELAPTYQHIGNCLSDQGDTEDAIEHFQEAIRLRELDTENDAERDADILSIEGVLHNLTGRQEEGLHYYEKALEILATKAPHRKEKIAALLHLIGCVYLMNGEHKKAMKLFQESLQTRRKVLGFVHLDVASTLFNIAFLHQTRNRLEKALKCLEEALKIRQLRLPDSEKVALTHEKIGTLCKAIGKSSKAEDAFEEALRIRRQIHGESHEAVATVLHEMGDLMDDLGEYEDAMRYYVDALDIRRKRLGPDHEDVAATLYSMGFTLHHQDSSERALQCFEESLNIRKRRLGEDSKEVGDALNTMGYLQAKRGELDDALNLLWGALRIRKLHDDHVKVSETLKNIGNVHREKQEHELAVECYEECLRIRRTELGDEHEKVADALIAIGNVRSDMESTEDAMRAYEEGELIQA